MLIELILNALLAVLFALTSGINIPLLPVEVTVYITEFMSYLALGASILSNYAPLGYLLSLFGVVIAVDIGISVYRVVMWVLKKLPMLGISD